MEFSLKSETFFPLRPWGVYTTSCLCHSFSMELLLGYKPLIIMQNHYLSYNRKLLGLYHQTAFSQSLPLFKEQCSHQHAFMVISLLVPQYINMNWDSHTIMILFLNKIVFHLIMQLIIFRPKNKLWAFSAKARGKPMVFQLF